MLQGEVRRQQLVRGGELARDLPVWKPGDPQAKFTPLQVHQQRADGFRAEVQA